MKPETVAEAIIRALVNRGLDRIYGLPGGHVKPLWDRAAQAGIRIVSVRSEGAAVHMAQADADLSGELAVAIVTTGPGFTNAVTAIASASLARSSVLVISAIPPRAQLGMGALEEIDQAEVARPIARFARTVHHGRNALRSLDRAISAALGEDGPPGPAYLDFPTDVLVDEAGPPYGPVPAAARRLQPMPPTSAQLQAAADLMRGATRPLVLAGAEAKRHRKAVARFIERIDGVFIDTRASRGTLPIDFPASVPATRVRAMAEADLVITLGRVLDFELAFGSPAVFSASARFLRIGRRFDEVALNRPGDVEVRADLGSALRGLERLNAVPASPDLDWRQALLRANAIGATRLAERISEARHHEGPGLHPLALIDELNGLIGDDSVVIVDGGDILSFARIALRARTYLDLGPFGCLGVGLPFANAAAMTFPSRPVVALVGDGAFGFHAMELETAVREGTGIVVVVANNRAWNIERQDQLDNYEGRVVGTELGDVAFGDLARSLGAHGEQVKSLADLRPALECAFQNAPAVVDVPVSRAPVSPDSRSGLAKVPPLQAIEPWEESERIWLFRNRRKEQPMSVVTHEVEGRERPRGYSDIATAGSIVAIAGQLPSDDLLGQNPSFADQYESALTRFVEALRAVGAGSNDILMLRIYVTDIRAYRESLRELASTSKSTFEGQYPATTLVEVSGLVDERAVVEIEGLAVIPQGSG